MHDMKIIATIANDEKPQGWREDYVLRKYYDLPVAQCAAKDQLEGIIARFNATLRPGEIPRRLLSFTLAELSHEEAIKMGRDDWHRGKTEDQNYFPSGHPMRTAWQDGWMDAQCEAEDAEEAEEVENEE